MIKSLNFENTSLLDEFKDVQNQKETLSKDFRFVQEKLIKVEKLFPEQLEKMKSPLLQNNRFLEKRLLATEKQIEEKQAKFDEMVNLNRGLNQQLDTTKSKNIKLNSEVVSLKQTMINLEEEIPKKLSMAKKAVESNLKELQSKFNKLNQSVNVRLKYIKSLEQQKNTLKNDLEQQDTQVSLLQETVGSLNNELKTFKEELPERLKEVKLPYEKEIEEYKKILNQRKSELNGKEKKLIENVSALNLLQKENSKIQSELTGLKQQYVKEKQENKANLVMLVNEIEVPLKEQINKLELKHKNLDSSIKNKIENVKRPLLEDNKALKEQIKISKLNIKRLDTENKKLIKQKEKIADKVVNIDIEKEKFKEEKSVLEEKIKDQNDNVIISLKNERKNLDEDNNNLKKNLDRLKDFIEKKNQNIVKLNLSREQLMHSLSMTIKEKEELAREIKRISQSYIKVEESIPEHLKSAKASLDMKIEIMSRELKQANLQNKKIQESLGKIRKQNLNLLDEKDLKNIEITKLKSELIRYSQTSIKRNDGLTQNNLVENKQLTGLREEVRSALKLINNN